jgi:hypothetical protein
MRDDEVLIQLQIFQVVPPLLHFFVLGTPVVVLLDHLWTDVHAVTDHHIWHLTVQAMRDAPAHHEVYSDYYNPAYHREKIVSVLYTL